MGEIETKKITLTIAGRPYPLRISTRDEAAIRKIAKEVNEKINQFQINYPNRDKQDCLAMAMLTYAVDLQLNKQRIASTQDNLPEQLSKLDELLNKALK